MDSNLLTSKKGLKTKKVSWNSRGGSKKPSTPHGMASFTAVESAAGDYTEMPNGTETSASKVQRIVDEDTADVENNGTIFLPTRPEDQESCISSVTSCQVEDNNITSLISSTKQLSRLISFVQEGPFILNLLSFFGGAGMVMSSVKDFSDRYDEKLPEYTVIVITFYIWASGIFIIALEGRPFQIQISSLHNMVSRNFTMLQYLWGRGVLYVFVGSIQLGLMTSRSIICGAYMMSVGFISFVAGMIGKMRLGSLNESIPKDHNTKIFNHFDKDNDGYLDREGFQAIVNRIGITQQEEIQFEQEFACIDKDNDGKINQIEFEDWLKDYDSRAQKITFTNMKSVT